MTGADGTYASVTAKYVLPGTWLPNKDFGAFLSGEFGHYWFGRTNSFYVCRYSIAGIQHLERGLFLHL